MTSVSVVIPTYNGWRWLEDCLRGMALQTHREVEVIVVDDGSTDGTADRLRDQWKGVRSVVLPDNRGFAVAMNAGFRAATGDLLIALNNDAVPGEEFVAEMAASADAGYDMVASRVILADRDVVDSAGIEVLRDGGSRERWRNLPAGDPRVLRPGEVFGPSAAAALYSRRMLERVGAFDETFEAYYEDVDLAWRGRIAGLRCAYNPSARVRHVHSATWGRLSLRKLFLLERNRYFTLWKDYPLSAWPAADAFHLLQAARTAGGTYLDERTHEQLRAIGRPALARLSARAAWAAWRRFPELLVRRRAVRSTATVPAAELGRWLTT